MSVLALTNPAVQSYIFYSSILALKMMAMIGLTILVRLTLKVFMNPEDAKMFNGSVKFDEPTVERVRRAHRNDLENIPVFWILGAFYLTTGPASTLAVWLFRVYTIVRVAHSLVYAVVPCPQPIRAIVFVIGVLIKCYMGIHVAIYYIASI